LVPLSKHKIWEESILMGVWKFWEDLTIAKSGAAT
ncbi:MAG: hypothetical protein ACI9O5_003272, partial [Algoriphagus sp.]